MRTWGVLLLLMPTLIDFFGNLIEDDSYKTIVVRATKFLYKSSNDSSFSLDPFEETEATSIFN